MWGYLILAVLFVATRAFGDDGTIAADAGKPDLLAAAVPVVVFAVKFLFDRVIPDSIVTKVKGEILPFVAMIAGVVLSSVQTGQVDFTQGATIGLIGVGLHQVAKQIGLVDNRLGILKN